MGSDIAAFQAQIELSASLARTRVASWLKGPPEEGSQPTLSSSSRSKSTSAQIKGRPPRLGVGASVGKGDVPMQPQSTSEKHLRKSLKLAAGRLNADAADQKKPGNEVKSRGVNAPDPPEARDAPDDDSKTLSAGMRKRKAGNLAPLDDYLNRGKKAKRKGHGGPGEERKREATRNDDSG